MVLETPVLIPAALLLPPPGVVVAALVGVASGTAARLASEGWLGKERLIATVRTTSVYVLIAAVVAFAAPDALPDTGLEILGVVFVLELIAIASALPVQILRGHLHSSGAPVSILAQVRPSLLVGPAAGLTAAVIVLLIANLGWAGLIGYAPVILVWIGGRRLVQAQQDRARLAVLHNLARTTNGATTTTEIVRAAAEAAERIFPGARVEVTDGPGGDADASVRVGEDIWVVARRRADAYSAGDHAILAIMGQMSASAVARMEHQTKVRRHDRIQTALLAAVGHDLQNPLTVQRGMAETLLNVGDELNPSQRTELVERIAAAARRMSRTVAGLVDLERVELGPAGHTGACIPADVLQAWSRGLELPNARTLQLDTSASAAASRVPLTPVQLERVVENLVFNACRHHLGDEPIVVQLARETGDLLIAVEDRGPGVSVEDRDLVLTAFGQGSGEGPRGSAGLGLFIVGRLVDHASGRLDIADRPGGGASFQVRLPVQPDNEA
jgi:signal transduction histidine kinase